MSAKPKSVHVYRGARGELFVDNSTMRGAYAPLAVGEYLGEYVPTDRALPAGVVKRVREYQVASSLKDKFPKHFALAECRMLSAIEADAKGGV